MNNSITGFCKAAPPTETEFRQIALTICNALNFAGELTFTCEEPSVEANAWVTVIVRAERDIPPLGLLSIYGTVSFVLREAQPEAGATLLLFMNRRRVTQGKMSVLEAQFDLKENAWLPFEWKRDAYGEWECDEVPQRN